MAYGYRLLRGKGGAGGYWRGNGENALLQGKGLAPGTLYRVYALEAQGAHPVASGRADRNGVLRLTLPLAGTLFVAADQAVALWEETGDPALNFWQAQAALGARRDAAPAAKAAETQEPSPEATATQAPVPTPPMPTPPAPARIAAPTPPKPEIAPEKAYSLRPESGAPPADVLPALVWPEAAAHLKAYFDTQTPFAPFDAPGWRFVRVPSPLRGVPYCAVGVQAQDARVTQVAYAVPGSPQQAPAALPGYRYQIGRAGQGYWTLWRKV